MKYLDPLPIIRIHKENNDNKIKNLKTRNSKNIKLIKNPKITINNYNYFFNKYYNVYGKTLQKTILGNSDLDYYKSEKKINNKKKLKPINTEYSLILNRNIEIETGLDFNKSINLKNVNFEESTIFDNIKNKKLFSKNNTLTIKNIKFNKTKKFSVDLNNINKDFLDIIQKEQKENQILIILRENFQLYDKLLKNINTNIFYKNYFLNFKSKKYRININSFILEIKNSKLMIPFTFSYFLICYTDINLIRFMKKVISIYYNKKKKNFNKSILKFEDFYKINKQLIEENTVITEDEKKKFVIKNIPILNKQKRKSIFINNNNKNVISKEDTIDINNLFVNNKKDENINNTSNLTSDSNSNSDTNSSSSSSMNEEDFSQISKKSLITKDNLNKMAIEFEGKLTNNKFYYSKIIFPLIKIIKEGYINLENNKLIRISNQEIKDIGFLNKEKILILLERTINKI